MSETPTVLDDVRRALGHTSTTAPTPLPPFVEPASSQADLVERFIAETTALKTVVVRVEGPEHVAAKVADICKAEGISSVVLSGSQFLAELTLKWQLEQFGLTSSRVAELQDAPKEELVAHLAGRQAGITAVDCAIAETGTILLTSDQDQSLLVSLLPPVHVAIVKVSQIVQSLSTAIERLGSQHMIHGSSTRSASFISGPSRTSDVELTLSIGVHGPKELYLVLVAGC